MVRVITSLKCCWHGIVNLDKLILIMKSWPNDLKFGCTNAKIHLKNFSILKTMWFLKMKILIVDFNLLKKIDMLFQIVMLNNVE